MKFFRGNPFLNEKTTRRLFSSSFLHSKRFPSERIQYKQNAITGGAALNNNHFNCPQPRYSSGKRSFQRYSKSIVLCVYRENIASSPISFHFDFPLLLNAGGLNERERPRYLCSPGGCGRDIRAGRRAETEAPLRPNCVPA